MNRIEKCELAVKKGFKYNPKSGEVIGLKGGVITKKCNGYIALTLWLDGKRSYLYAHQFAWYLTHGKTVKLIDHINRNKTDNSIANLRSTTKQINAYNIDNRGTYLDKRTNKWESGITINGVKKHIGLFETEELAHKKYLEYKLKLIA